MLGSGGYSLNYQYRTDLLEHFGTMGQECVYQKNTLVEFEHRVLDHVYLIMDGIVKQYFTNADGVEKTILVLSRGDMFGEITMLQQDLDHCLTRAYSNVVLRKIPRTEFDAYLQACPQSGQSVMLMLTTKVRVMMYQIYDSAYLDTKGRLYSLLERIAMQHGIGGETGRELLLPLTHEEIACMIGSTRSTVTKLMRALEEEGKIYRQGKRLSLQALKPPAQQIQSV